jgi:UDP-N-acetylglucosamine 3-dehydrogenase
VAPLRAAVIGLGSMGANHVRVLADMPELVELAAVADPDEARLRQAARRSGALPYRDAAELLEAVRPEIVTICTPTRTHAAIAELALRSGAHVLVEKPIAASAEDAERLAALAAAEGRLLAVGHIERFNPAVAELARRLGSGEGGRILQVHARRVGPFPHRIRDVGVIHDLATHDIDVLRFLLGDDVERVYAEAQRHIATEHDDLFVGVLHFRRGPIALLEANWLTPAKERSLRVLCERGMYTVDYLAQTLTFYENHAAVAREGQPASVTEGPMTRYPIPYREPLRAELEAFVGAVAEGGPPPVSAADGVEALRIADALARSAAVGQPVTLAAAPAP